MNASSGSSAGTSLSAEVPFAKPDDHEFKAWEATVEEYKDIALPKFPDMSSLHWLMCKIANLVANGSKYRNILEVQWLNTTHRIPMTEASYKRLAGDVLNCLLTKMEGSLPLIVVISMVWPRF